MAIRVVLVDDVPEVRQLVRTALRFRGGFEIVGEAGDGTEAVKLAAQEQPDVVVLDLGLPDLAGRDVLAGIREQSPVSKVVIFSGTETTDRAQLAKQVEGFVMKDDDLDFLIDLLETLGSARRRHASVELSCELGSVMRSRRFVRETFAEWGITRAVDDALIVVSELVTNAITHAGSPCQVRLSIDETSVRVEVFDEGAGTPDPQPASSTSEHGRGLHLITALTAAWGIQQIPDDGKIVWAELPRTG
ncbi:MAG TPA: response regulator [Mycobacteriales bacterium]|nr:response regulator [Mycobacteriales bacterium]